MPNDQRLRIIVLGYVIREPTGGMAWLGLNYVLGLLEAGHDVYYMEDSDDVPSCYGPNLDGPTTDATFGLKFAGDAFNRLGVGDRWAYYDAHTGEWRGSRASDARVLCRDADLVLHVFGFNPLRDWFERVPARAVVDLDPGFTQVRNLTDAAFRRRTELHTAFFTIGENFGNPECSIPDDGFPWQPTRQPTALSVWPYSVGPRAGRYTSVMQWQTWRSAWEYDGLRLGNKAESFEPFVGLPERAGPVFELAIRARWDSPHDRLRNAGWGLADIDVVSRDPWSYQAFVRGSKGEFGVAKAGYVATRGGWFSDRSLAYLASGRPVLHQDTGFSDWLPCGLGVLAFRSPGDVVAGMEQIELDYERHCRAARELAEEYFSAHRVLPALVDRAMATSPSEGRPPVPAAATTKSAIGAIDAPVGPRPRWRGVRALVGRVLRLPTA